MYMYFICVYIYTYSLPKCIYASNTRITNKSSFILLALAPHK